MKNLREVAEKLCMDRRQDHHDGEPTHEYCPHCDVCKDCTVNEIESVLKEVVAEYVDSAIVNLHAKQSKSGLSPEEVADMMKEARSSALAEAENTFKRTCLLCYMTSQDVMRHTDGHLCEHLKKAHSAGKAEGLEQAALIVERECGNGCTEDHRKYIVSKIRALMGGG